METEIGELPNNWDKYVAWCQSNGLLPKFDGFLIWLDDYDHRPI